MEGQELGSGQIINITSNNQKVNHVTHIKTLEQPLKLVDNNTNFENKSNGLGNSTNSPNLTQVNSNETSQTPQPKKNSTYLENNITVGDTNVKTLSDESANLDKEVNSKSCSSSSSDTTEKDKNISTNKENVEAVNVTQNIETENIYKEPFNLTLEMEKLYNQSTDIIDTEYTIGETEKVGEDVHTEKVEEETEEMKLRREWEGHVSNFIASEILTIVLPKFKNKVQTNPLIY
jgi:hypothetical protein